MTTVKLKEAEVLRPPALRHYNKEQTPSQGHLPCGHRYFAVDVSVFAAHLLRSPLIVKSGIELWARTSAGFRHTAPVASLGSLAPNCFCFHRHHSDAAKFLLAIVSLPLLC